MAHKVAKSTRRTILRVVVSPNEAAEIREASRRLDQSVSRFLREVGLAKAGGVLQLPLLGHRGRNGDR